MTTGNNSSDFDQNNVPDSTPQAASTPEQSSTFPAAPSIPPVPPPAAAPGSPYQPTQPAQPAAPQYGYPQPPQPPQPQEARTNVLAIVTFVLGLLGFAIVPVITGHISLNQIKARGEQGRVFAIIGLVLGYLGVLAWVIFWIVFFAALGSASTWS